MHRDWTYVDDIVQGVVAAADRPLGYEVINLGRGAADAPRRFRSLDRRAGGQALEPDRQADARGRHGIHLRQRRPREGAPRLRPQGKRRARGPGLLALVSGCGPEGDMSRLKTRTSQFLIDISVLMLAFLLAVLVRFDWSVPEGGVQATDHRASLCGAVAVRVPVRVRDHALFMALHQPSRHRSDLRCDRVCNGLVGRASVPEPGLGRAFPACALRRRSPRGVAWRFRGWRSSG